MKNPGRVTIKDVARIAGVSAQTVSRVINDRPDVAPETRLRIQQVIEDLGYNPSALARSLIQQRSYTLGVVTAGLKFIGPSRTLNGITQRCEELGYSLLLKELPGFTSGDSHALIRSLIARHVDGIVWATAEVGDNQDWVSEGVGDLPVPVVFTASQQRAGIFCVSYDNFLGAKIAVQHLIDQGCRRVAHITGPLDWWEARERLAGWQEVLQENGLEDCLDCFVEGNWSATSGDLAMSRLLEEHSDLDGVFAGNDQMAQGAYHAIYSRGLQIPADLAMVGFDGLPEARYYWPPLSTIYQDQNLMGCTAVNKIAAIIESLQRNQAPGEPESTILVPELSVRASSIRDQKS